MKDSTLARVDEITTLAEKKVSKSLRKSKRELKRQKMTMIGIGIVSAILVSAFVINGLNQFFSEHEFYFRSPFQNPVVLNKRTTKIISPIPEKKTEKLPEKRSQKENDTVTAIELLNAPVDADKITAVQNSKYPLWINHIWIHESGQGTNNNPNALHNRCNAKGMSNDFGYYPKGDWCWNTFEEGVRRLERWRENEAKDLTDNQALCYYNGAGKVESCAYLTNDYLSMN